MDVKYKRILLKISGEALSGTSGHGFDSASLKSVAEQIKKVVELGVETGVVVGGGNIWRGRQGLDMDRVTADQMGMLATVINALAVSGFDIDKKMVVLPEPIKKLGVYTVEIKLMAGVSAKISVKVENEA